ncbi:tRNA (guanosine(37)-N1)-methyltransferase TrmD [Cryobacterium sp.]|jgi:tRNA (guanine37-N1)-methyltransferase|uniref:tRNA (guanosine(37)-N1)-methyltransferase TrmD n=1 Tax=Cryobacterium sp. TaxID=1926290 RepID=UPI00260E977D|nr:tRNA (guanosine(37)-N1)-methyltransferase TrmD [Cryobacterium sp.]MCU1445862.1 tRNA ((37)-N1)-methyltransferase TrmD [Cryobacterium sp.]
MRIDIISIFPEFFGVLDISLLGRARQAGLIDLAVHNLRDFTHDRHSTVDDTPYGGGAGMVMKPEPWGEALDSILPAAPEPGVMPTGAGTGPVLIFPSPAGEQFTQAMARELAAEPHLVFGCGRYEGIDQRVVDHFAGRGRVRLVSLGDYVLNGGEVAVMAMIEAIGRLIPGVVGNPESLVEESHEDGLLEYPSYTKPASWRGLDVPPVLLSGNHGAIATWRREKQLERTRAVRPDLLPADMADAELLPPANSKARRGSRG